MSLFVLGIALNKAPSAGVFVPCPLVQFWLKTSAFLNALTMQADALTMQADALTMQADALTMQTDALTMQTDALTMQTDALTMQGVLPNLIRALIEMLYLD